jgi:hypothetical protein
MGRGALQYTCHCFVAGYARRGTCSWAAARDVGINVAGYAEAGDSTARRGVACSTGATSATVQGSGLYYRRSVRWDIGGRAYIIGVTTAVM